MLADLVDGLGARADTRSPRCAPSTGSDPSPSPPWPRRVRDGDADERRRAAARRRRAVVLRRGRRPGRGAARCVLTCLARSTCARPPWRATREALRTRSTSTGCSARTATARTASTTGTGWSSAGPARRPVSALVRRGTPVARSWSPPTTTGSGSTTATPASPSASAMAACAPSSRPRRARSSCAPCRLGDVETMHAMTVHKSQGSQADEVTVLMPPEDSRLLTRELFYTAITRARSLVRVVGTEAEIRAAVERRAIRATGLRAGCARTRLETLASRSYCALRHIGDGAGARRGRPMLSDGEIANAATLEAHRRDRARRRSASTTRRCWCPTGTTRPRSTSGTSRRWPTGPTASWSWSRRSRRPRPGEGKTTTTVGLTDALRRVGQRSCGALREPSMGPVFGMKGGAAGGGYAQVVPMTDINLHFTGDFAAIAAANNLLAALIDNHVHHGNALDIDVRSITWKRVVDLNDRALRQTVVGLGGTANGYPREDGFDIVVASRADGDLLPGRVAGRTSSERIGRIVVAHDRSKKPVTAADLGAEGALAVLLKNALAPNLVQTLEHAPVFVHGGPFANIAHGCNSVIATRTALKLADIVVTEAGFGSDLGAEKFIDIKCRKSGLRPDAVVVVATVRALKYHGGVAVPDLQKEDVEAVRRGLRQHRAAPHQPARRLRAAGGGGDQPVPLRHRRGDPGAARPDPGASASRRTPRPTSSTAAPAPRRSPGACSTSSSRARRTSGSPTPTRARSRRRPTAIATKLYGAAGVTFAAKARKQLAQIVADGFAHLPVCVAKTQYSFSTDPKAARRPDGAHHRRPRGPALRRRRLHRAGHRRHHDDARPAEGPGLRPHRHRRRTGWSPACRRARRRSPRASARRFRGADGGNTRNGPDSVADSQRGVPPCPSCCASRCPTSPARWDASATAIGEAGGDIEAIEIVEKRHDGTAVDDVLLEMAPGRDARLGRLGLHPARRRRGASGSAATPPAATCSSTSRWSRS